jgi:5,10-methylenetetrahydromethanopterin reductase
MQLGCLFPPTMSTPDDIALAEELGYERALVYDSPSFLADPWITLALAAARTSRIRIGVAAITPRLRHVVATAGALATLASAAPGRVEAVIGSGFTAALMLGKKPAPWAEVEAYATALRALLGGQEIEWDGATVGLKHSSPTGVTLPCEIPLSVAAHGPRGYATAARLGCPVVTNPSHTGPSHTVEYAAPVQNASVLYYGTVLDPGEDPGSPRALNAAGPYATFQLHLGQGGGEEQAGFDAALAKVDERRRHLELHQGHLLAVTEFERPYVTGSLVARTTGTGSPGDVGRWLKELEASGTRGVLYGPMGASIGRELTAFASVFAAATQ